ncbi:hypothetical protein ACIQMR_35405 [Streptomyces sp. NPDC091376]|uniref:hypothetical protein n=1 Tax=Streptomyces sp. NPDC091376 TaxID=3365994 RepID=UPI0038072D6D
MTVPEQRLAPTVEADATYSEIVARLINCPTPAQVHAALAHHAAYIRAKAATENVLCFDGKSAVVEDEPQLVDRAEDSLLYEVWVKREEEGP